MSINFDVKGQQGMHLLIYFILLTGGSIIMDRTLTRSDGLNLKRLNNGFVLNKSTQLEFWDMHHQGEPVIIQSVDAVFISWHYEFVPKSDFFYI